MDDLTQAVHPDDENPNERINKVFEKAQVLWLRLDEFEREWVALYGAPFVPEGSGCAETEEFIGEFVVRGILRWRRDNGVDVIGRTPLFLSNRHVPMPIIEHWATCMEREWQERFEGKL